MNEQTSKPPKDLLSAFDALQSADRDEATRRYAAIIRRHDKPKAKDGETLRELMVTLGITRQTVEADIVAYRMAGELEAAIVNLGDYEAEAHTAGEAVIEADRRVKEAEAVLKEAKGASASATAKRQAANGCKRDLQAIKAKHAYLFAEATDD